jgi:uroporphyrinogen decarboxylase
METTMNSKQRVYNSILRKPVDRSPQFIWLGGTVAPTIAEKEGIPPEEVNAFIGNDIMQTWLSINGQMERPAAEGETFVDEWGINWERQGYYNAPIIHPLSGLDEEKIPKYPLPDPRKRERFDALEALIAKYGKTHFIGADLSGSLFEPAYHLKGMEELLMDMAGGESEAEVLLDRLCEFTGDLAEEALKRDIDWVWLGDDVGTQQGMIMSPALWRQWLKPRMAKLIKRIRGCRPDAIVAYHSCGSVWPIVDDLAEIGINVLNPVQESAAGMNQGEIKAKYGHALTLMCGVDTQQFLPSASPEAVKKAVREIDKKLSNGGGYILAVSHSVQPDVSLENIYALFEKYA